jgi:hypothetical protein
LAPIRKERARVLTCTISARYLASHVVSRDFGADWGVARYGNARVSGNGLAPICRDGDIADIVFDAGFYDGFTYVLKYPRGPLVLRQFRLHHLAGRGGGLRIRIVGAGENYEARPMAQAVIMGIGPGRRGERIKIVGRVMSFISRDDVALYDWLRADRRRQNFKRARGIPGAEFRSPRTVCGSAALLKACREIIMKHSTPDTRARRSAGLQKCNGTKRTLSKKIESRRRWSGMAEQENIATVTEAICAELLNPELTPGGACAAAFRRAEKIKPARGREGEHARLIRESAARFSERLFNFEYAQLRREIAEFERQAEACANPLPEVDWRLGVRRDLLELGWSGAEITFLEQLLDERERVTAVSAWGVMTNRREMSRLAVREQSRPSAHRNVASWMSQFPVIPTEPSAEPSSVV